MANDKKGWSVNEKWDPQVLKYKCFKDKYLVIAVVCRPRNQIRILSMNLQMF